MNHEYQAHQSRQKVHADTRVLDALRAGCTTAKEVGKLIRADACSVSRRLSYLLLDGRVARISSKRTSRWFIAGSAELDAAIREEYEAEGKRKPSWRDRDAVDRAEFRHVVRCVTECKPVLPKGPRWVFDLGLAA